MAAIGQGEAAARGLAQGLTLNFSDKLSGLSAASGLPEAAKRLLPPGPVAAVGIGGARVLAEKRPLSTPTEL